MVAGALERTCFYHSCLLSTHPPNSCQPTHAHPHTCSCLHQVIFRAGAYLDLASNDGAALVNASDSAYDLSGMSVEVSFARCNLAPHTIMRGPGYLQGCMVMEQVNAESGVVEGGGGGQG